MLAVAGCAPHVPRVAELAPALRAERYRQLLTTRELRGAGVDAQVVVWARVSGTSRLPAAEGRLLLAAPDGFRIRLGSIFGTALDLGGRGDSLSAYVPSRRQGMTLDAQRDTLGVRRPGGLAFRALSGSWRPPESAWERAQQGDSLLEVRWLEDPDTVTVAIGSEGLPAWASLTRSDGGGVRVGYRSWDRTSGIAWPSVIDVVDLRGPLRVTCKVTQVHFSDRVDPWRLAVAIPPSADHLTLAALRRALERLGTL
jgi:hypothetical protein